MKSLVKVLVKIKELVSRTRIKPLYRGSSKVEQTVDNRSMTVRFCLSVESTAQVRSLTRACHHNVQARPACCRWQTQCSNLDQLHHQDRNGNRSKIRLASQHHRQQMLEMKAPKMVGIGVFSNALRFERRVPGAKPGFPVLWLSSKGKTGGCELPDAVSRPASHPKCAVSQDSKAPVCNSGTRQCKSAIALSSLHH